MPTADPTSAAILLVSTPDWDNPFWTNKQHVASELARQGRRVLFVESAGLRPPVARRKDFARIWRRLLRALATAREVAPRLWVCSPPTLPWQAFGVVRALNRWLLAWSLGRAARRAGFQPRLLLTYSPLTTELYDLGRFELTAYHCVDDVSAQPGMPRAILSAAEDRLARRADVVFVTTPLLEARCRTAGARRVHLLPNVCDAAHFGQALAPERCEPHDLAAIPRPRIGFVGAISGYKIDLALLHGVARARPHYSFVLIGAIGEGEPRTDVDPLRRLPNLHLMGPRAYSALPAYLGGFDVAILPSADNTYTRAMFPMKFFEYLAAGLPVVATPLPGLAAHAEFALTAPPEPEAFAAAIDRALAGDGPTRAERLRAAASHTYASRTAEMLAMLDAVVAESGPASNRERRSVDPCRRTSL